MERDFPSGTDPKRVIACVDQRVNQDHFRIEWVSWGNSLYGKHLLLYCRKPAQSLVVCFTSNQNPLQRILCGPLQAS